MNYTQLSERLAARANWSINAVGIRRIESRERRVTVDDLMALAVALGVSPATLLYPDTSNAHANSSVTGLPEGEGARAIWEWISASVWAYWVMERVGGFTKPSDFFRRAWPAWMIEEMSKPVEGATGTALDGYDVIWNKAREDARRNLVEAGWIDESEPVDGNDQ